MKVFITSSWPCLYPIKYIQNKTQLYFQTFPVCFDVFYGVLKLGLRLFIFYLKVRESQSIANKLDGKLRELNIKYVYIHQRQPGPDNDFDMHPN